jgi:hypothetical protein
VREVGQQIAAAEIEFVGQLVQTERDAVAALFLGGLAKPLRVLKTFTPLALLFVRLGQHAGQIHRFFDRTAVAHLHKHGCSHCDGGGGITAIQQHLRQNGVAAQMHTRIEAQPRHAFADRLDLSHGFVAAPCDVQGLNQGVGAPDDLSIVLGFRVVRDVVQPIAGEVNRSLGMVSGLFLASALPGVPRKGDMSHRQVVVVSARPAVGHFDNGRYALCNQVKAAREWVQVSQRGHHAQPVQDHRTQSRETGKVSTAEQFVVEIDGCDQLAAFEQIRAYRQL